MTYDTIDTATYRALEESAGADFVADLAATFLEEAPRMLEALDGALTVRDADAFRRAAHSLKSNSLTFGAMRLAGMARELEQDAKGAITMGHRGPLDAIAAEYSRVADALARLRHA